MEPLSHIPETIRSVVDQIARLAAPEAIYLFGNKRGERGKTTGFKLLVVAEHQSREQAERELYLKIDCEVPFDVVVYSPEEFASLRGQEGSFARKIAETGVMLYGKTPV